MSLHLPPFSKAQAESILVLEMNRALKMATDANGSMDDFTRETVLNAILNAECRCTVGETVYLLKNGKRYSISKIKQNNCELFDICGDDARFWMNASSLSNIRNELAKVPRVPAVNLLLHGMK